MVTRAGFSHALSLDRAGYTSLSSKSTPFISMSPDSEPALADGDGVTALCRADADARWPNTVSPWQCYCGAVWRLEEASDDEDKATMSRDEGERSNWSRFLAKATLLKDAIDELDGAGPQATDEARGRRPTRTASDTEPVTHLRKRATSRSQPLPEREQGALAATGELASG